MYLVDLQYPIYHGLVISSMVEKRDSYLFVQAAASMMAVSLLSKLLNQIENYFFGNEELRISLRIKRDYFRAATRQELAYHDSVNSSELSSRLNYECDWIARFVSNDMNKVINEMCMLVGSFVAMLSISWRLSLVPLMVIPLSQHLRSMRSHYHRAQYNRRYAADKAPMHIANEALGNMRMVRTFGCEEYECKRYTAATEKAFNFNYAHGSIGACVREWLMQFADNGMLFSLLIYGGYLVQKGWMEPTAIITFLLFEREFTQQFQVGT